MSMKNLMHSFPGLIWLMIALSLPATATAADAYRFEMVIFERPGGSGAEAWPVDPSLPDTTKAVGSLEAISVGGRLLGPVAYTLNRRGMTVLDHIAWVQVPRGRGSEAWYRIDGTRLSGLIRVTRGRFLHIDADLFLRDAATSSPYHIRLYRRMRSDELHYIDHPKLGIVIRADRLRARSEPDAADAAAGEPKPAEPAGAEQPG